MTDRAGTSPHHRTSTSTSVPEVFASPIASPLSAPRNVRPISLHSHLLEEKNSDNVRFSRCFHHRQACPCQGFRQGSPFHLVGNSLYVVLALLCAYRAFGFNWPFRLFVSLRRANQKRIRGLTCVLFRSRQQAQRSRQSRSLRRFAHPIALQSAYTYYSVDP